jgi:Na+/pantothenate symporter
MNERPDNLAIICAFGILLLMCALGSAIFLGTSQLIAPEAGANFDSLLMTGAFFVVVFSLLGGFLVSYGFIIALRGREKRENTQLS